MKEKYKYYLKVKVHGDDRDFYPKKIIVYANNYKKAEDRAKFIIDEICSVNPKISEEEREEGVHRGYYDLVVKKLKR